MSCKELMASLRQAADERIRLLWQEAEKEAAAVKAELAARREELRSDIERRKSDARRDAAFRAVSEAQNRARAARLIAEKALADRLFAAAGASLELLRNGNYEALFGTMARELPALPWKIVRVNPADVALAAAYFPGAEIVPDAGIAGGVDASAEDGRIRIINTFDKRLERAWSDMLPGLIREISREVADGTAGAS